MPDETKMPESKPKMAVKPKPDPKAVAPKVGPAVEAVAHEESKLCVRVTKNIRMNGGRGSVLYGHKGLYFGDEAEMLMAKHPDCVEVFVRKE